MKNKAQESHFANDAWMMAYSANRQIFNPSVMKHNQFDGHIATAKHCGTHWIKYMLSHVLSQIHDLPPPQHVRDDAIIGRPRFPPQHGHTPQLVVTHSQPHYAMRIPSLCTLLKTPRCAFFVRDPKDLLVSIYEKYKGDFIDDIYQQENVTFSDYLRSPVTQRTRIETMWGLIRFFNAWGAIQDACPKRTTLVKYEDLLNNTEAELTKICTHFGIEGATPKILQNAIERSSREKMRKKLDKTEAQYERSVNVKKRDFEDWYSAEDTEFFNAACHRYLKYDFGYLAKQDT